MNPLTDHDKHEVRRLIMTAGPLRARQWLVDHGYDERAARDIAFEEEKAIERDTLEQESPQWYLMVFLAPFGAVASAALTPLRLLFRFARRGRRR